MSPSLRPVDAPRAPGARRAPGRVRRLAGLTGAAALLAAGTVVGAGAGLVPGAPGAPAAAADPTDVFIGVVDDADYSARAGSGAQAGSGGSTAGQRTASYDVTVLSVYLGDISTEEVQVTSTPAFFGCPNRQVELGQQYAFRVAGEGDRLVATACRDVRPATATVRTALGRTYPDVRPPVESGVTYDEVASTDTGLGAPAEFTRTAAPGAALVIVGLLGLLVARRFARRPR